MGEETKIGIKNVTHDILDLFLGIPESLLIGFDRSQFYRVLRGDIPDKVLTCSNICKVFNAFKHRGYIEVKETAGGIQSVRFTNKAKLAVIDRIASKISESDVYCLVSFDIPEQRRANRDRFRRAIKRMGFRQIQKSLWVNNKRVGKLVEIAASEYRVEEYVVYFISNATNINDHIEKLFEK